jgi:acyl transferase domain-containing protein/acyl carrier protein
LLTSPLSQAECELVCTELLSLPSLFPTIFDPDPIKDIVTLHCALFSIQYACAKSWLDSGLKVDRIIGHSFGQLTALCVAGSLSLFEAFRLVSERARLVEAHCGPENGLMLAVEGSDVDHLLRLAEQQCQHFSADIACYNGPRSFVIAGDDASIQAIEKASEALPTSFRLKRLDNSHAFHSQLLDGIIPGLLQAAGELHFGTPVIPIEACSNDDDWSKITAEKIARHTRMPVHFMDTVRRVEQQVNGPVIWLEAGSGSPIIPMIKRAVISEPPSHQHVYISTSLRNSDAQINLAKAICRLWSNGVRAQFWPFHRSQRSSYNWVNLPPYQFAKTSHWLDYKPAASIWETPTIASANSHSELLQLLPNQARQGEALFEINPKNELYRLSTQGHEVVDQSLCPASLYIEFVLTASRLLSDAETAFVPHISGLAMSSPLVLNPVGRVFLKLVEKKSQSGSWDFSIFSQNEQAKHDAPINHSTGCVTVSKFGTLSTISHFQSLKGLILQRCNEIESSSMSIGFKGPTVYQAMRRVVTYLDYYHGIQSIYTLGSEAIAHVTLPPARPSSMGAGFCDPVLVDSFTQVSGVLANCFTLDGDNEMWVCNFIGEIAFTQTFVENGRKEHSWIVYCKYEKPSPKRLQCNIFVFEPQSGHLVLTIMSIEFQKVSIKSLSKILSRLNSLKTPIHDVPAKASSDRIETDFLAYGTAHAAIAHQPVQKELPNGITDTTGNRFESLQKIKEMLRDVIEIPLEEISPDSTLEDLGIDSLLVTEIFTEINKRFKVLISHSDFATITDVRGLAQLVSSEMIPSSSPPSTLISTHQSSTTHASPSPQSTLISTHQSSTSHAAIANQPVQKIKEMLSDIIEIPLEEISPDSILEDLGIDSLLATEIFAEMNMRFKVSISHSDFATIFDVQGLAQLISSSCPSSTSTSTSTSTPRSTSSSTQIDIETVVYGEGDGTPLSADIYYPNGLGDTQRPLPIGGSTHPPCL